MEQERTRFEEGEHHVYVPYYMKEIVAEITRLARRTPEINQRSGVSVRASIANYESLLANALRRAIRLGEEEVVPRISDLPHVIPSLSGKLEFETMEEGREEQIMDRLIQGAVLTVFNRCFTLGELESVVAYFKGGAAVEVSDVAPSAEYVKLLSQIGGLAEALKKLEVDASPARIASGAEFIFEGLHLNKRLNKERIAGRYQYRG